jgi:phage shock protein PspC (stress-responsive transcriptional regulator)
MTNLNGPPPEREADERDESVSADEQVTATPAQEPTPGWRVEKRLLRSRSDRMLTGLAAGAADYMGIDAVWVRAGLVVLAVMTGGIAIIGYFVLAIFVPEESGTPGEQPRGVAETLGRTTGMFLGLVLVVAGLLWLLASLDLQVDIDLDIDWVLILAGALVAVGALLVLSGGGFMRGPLIALGVLLVLFLGPLDNFGIPDNGGAFGDRVERVGNVAALDDNYAHAFGSLTLDLRNLELPNGTTAVSVNSAFGEARVLVPQGAAVRVEASGAFGSVDALGEESSGLGFQQQVSTAGYDDAPRRLLIDVNSAFGSVEVRR